MNQSELAQSNYHYHHQMCYQYLVQAYQHLLIARRESQLSGQIPDWILGFETHLKHCLETVPEIQKALQAQAEARYQAAVPLGDL